MNNQDTELKTADQFIEAAITKVNETWEMAEGDEITQDLIAGASYALIAIALMLQDSQKAIKTFEVKG